MGLVIAKMHIYTHMNFTKPWPPQWPSSSMFKAPCMSYWSVRVIEFVEGGEIWWKGNQTSTYFKWGVRIKCSNRNQAASGSNLWPLRSLLILPPSHYWRFTWAFGSERKSWKDQSKRLMLSSCWTSRDVVDRTSMWIASEDILIMSYHVSICEYVNLWHVMANVANNLPLRDGTHMIQWDPSIRNRKSEGKVKRQKTNLMIPADMGK